MSSIRVVADESAVSVSAFTLAEIASCFFDELADVGKAFVRGVLQRFDVIANRLDLALGVSQHVFDIGHLCLSG
jgi:hypothetical protein